MAYSTFPWFFQRFTDSDGNPLAGGSVRFCVAGGGLTLKPIYLDQSGTEASNPMPLDSVGFPESNYFGGDGEYDVYVYDSAGAPVRTILRVTVAASGAYVLPIASETVLGGIKIGNNLSIDEDGVLSADPEAYNLPTASNTIKGGVKVGSRLSIDADGVLSADDQSYELPVATETVLGGVKKGANVEIAVDGTISVAAPYELPVANTAELGGVKQGDNVIIAPDGTLSVNADALLDGKIKATPADPTPGYLEQKIQDSETISLHVDPETNSLVADFIGDDIVGYDAEDLIPGWLSDKLKAGTGVTFTVTEDGVHGKVIHVNISSADQGKVRVDADDISLRYLADKIVAGSNITLTREIIEGADARVRIAAFAAGSLGYEGAVKAFGDALSIGSSTAIQNVLSIELPAGTWDVTGAVSTYVVQSGVLPVQMRCNISNVSATIDYDGWDSWADRVQTGGGSLSQTIASKRYILSVPTTIYLCAQAASGTFASGLMWGNLTARQAA